MKFPENNHFHSEHMWARREGELCTLGVSDFAQTQLGEVSIVVVPEPGVTITVGMPFGTIESTKVASDLIAPISGEIVEVNQKLANEPWLINDDAYGGGWIVRVRQKDIGQFDKLLTAADYRRKIK